MNIDNIITTTPYRLNDQSGKLLALLHYQSLLRDKSITDLIEADLRGALSYQFGGNSDVERDLK